MSHAVSYTASRYAVPDCSQSRMTEKGRGRSFVPATGDSILVRRVCGCGRGRRLDHSRGWATRLLTDDGVCGVGEVHSIRVRRCAPWSGIVGEA